jgi:hypothetical protein
MIMVHLKYAAALTTQAPAPKKNYDQPRHEEFRQNQYQAGDEPQHCSKVSR